MWWIVDSLDAVHMGARCNTQARYHQIVDRHDQVPFLQEDWVRPEWTFKTQGLWGDWHCCPLLVMSWCLVRFGLDRLHRSANIHSCGDLIQQVNRAWRDCVGSTLEWAALDMMVRVGTPDSVRYLLNHNKLKYSLQCETTLRASWSRTSYFFQNI